MKPKSRLKFENRLVKKIEAALAGERRLDYDHVARGRAIRREIQSKYAINPKVIVDGRLCNAVREIQEDEDRKIMDLLEEAEGKM